MSDHEPLSARSATLGDAGRVRPVRSGSAVGLDLGGTKILGVLLDVASGEVVREAKIPNPRSSVEDVVDAFRSLTRQLVEHRPPLTSIGIGLAGLVDLDGVLRYGPNVPGIIDFSVRQSLEAAFSVPVVIDNDAAMALRAELDRGAAVGLDDVLLVTQGTGIGGALAVGGQPVRGANGFAGEPGHMLIQRGGHRCACGQLGCWEAYASGAGLVNLWNDLLAEGRGLDILARAGGVELDVRGEHVSDAAADGDRDAIEIFERFSSWVAQGLGSLVTLLDPDVVVLGGGLARANEHFLADVQEQMHLFVLGAAHRPLVPVVGAALGETSGAVGAALAGISDLR